MTTACELLAKPEGYDRRIVTIRGHVQTGFQDSYLVDGRCGGLTRIWLDWADDLPEEPWSEFALVTTGRDWYDFMTGRRSDFEWRPWLPRPHVELARDASFRELNDYLSRRSPQIPLSRGRAHYDVEATITGRFDHLPGTIILRNEKGERGMQVGFGPRNGFMDRIVVEGVADVRATRIADD